MADASEGPKRGEPAPPECEVSLTCSVLGHSYWAS